MRSLSLFLLLTALCCTYTQGWFVTMPNALSMSFLAGVRKTSTIVQHGQASEQTPAATPAPVKPHTPTPTHTLAVFGCSPNVSNTGFHMVQQALASGKFAQVFCVLHRRGTEKIEEKIDAFLALLASADGKKIDTRALRFHQLDALDRVETQTFIEKNLPNFVVSCLGDVVTTESASIFSLETGDRAHAHVHAHAHGTDETQKSRKVVSSDYEGNKNIIDSIKKTAEKIDFFHRFLLMTAVGAGESEGWIPSVSVDSIRVWLTDKTLAEKYLKNSGLEYAILRPCPFDDRLIESDSETAVAVPPVDDADPDFDIERAVVTEGPVYGLISRRGTASLSLPLLFSEKSKNKTLAAVDMHRVMQAEPYVRPFLNWEALPFEVFPLE